MYVLFCFSMKSVIYNQNLYLPSPYCLSWSLKCQHNLVTAWLVTNTNDIWIDIKIFRSQGKSEGLDSCDRPSNFTQIGFKSSIRQPVYLDIWWVTSKNNRTPLLYYFKLCASFQIHQWIQTGVKVRKPSVRVKIGKFLSRVTLKFDGWPWETIGHLFYAISSFVHFVAFGEFKLELQSGNVQFGSNSTIFFSCVTLELDRWLWKPIGHLFYAAWSQLKMRVQMSAKHRLFCPHPNMWIQRLGRIITAIRLNAAFGIGGARLKTASPWRPGRPYSEHRLADTEVTSMGRLSY